MLFTVNWSSEQRAAEQSSRFPASMLKAVPLASMSVVIQVTSLTFSGHFTGLSCSFVFGLEQRGVPKNFLSDH